MPREVPGPFPLALPAALEVVVGAAVPEDATGAGATGATGALGTAGGTTTGAAGAGAFVPLVLVMPEPPR